MDIPQAVRAAKKTRAAQEFPAMARHEHVLDQFVDAELQQQWEADPLFQGIDVEQEDYLAVMKLARRGGSNTLVKMTFPELLDAYQKIGALLFGE